MISIRTSESVKPYARWNSATGGVKQANSIGESSMNSGAMAQVTIHFRAPVRYSATGWISPSWKAQLARSSEVELQAARSNEARTKEMIRGRRKTPAGPEVSDR